MSHKPRETVVISHKFTPEVARWAEFVTISLVRYKKMTKHAQKPISICTRALPIGLCCLNVDEQFNVYVKQWQVGGTNALRPLYLLVCNAHGHGQGLFF